MFTHLDTVKPHELVVHNIPKGRYYVTPGGNRYPSITTLLGAKDKPWLTDWRNSLGHDKADAEMKRAVIRGEAIHAMAEKFLKNDPNPTENQDIDHIREFNPLKLRLKKVDNILLQEAPLWSDTLKVAGRVDVIAEHLGVLSVVDFKTSTNTKDERMIEDYFLQTTAYALMFQEMYGIQIDQVVILMTTEKGIVPQLHKAKVDDMIEPLILRINTYYESKKQEATWKKQAATHSATQPK